MPLIRNEPSRFEEKRPLIPSEMRCPVCLDAFRGPVSLRCNHHVCHDHLISLAASVTPSGALALQPNKRLSVTCPKCQHVSVFKKGLLEVRVNCEMQAMISVMQLVLTQQQQQLQPRQPAATSSFPKAPSVAVLVFLCLFACLWLGVNSYPYENKDHKVSALVSSSNAALIPVACQSVPQFGDLLNTHGFRLHLLLLHHGGRSEEIARDFQRCRENWVTLVHLPRTPFFESGVMLSALSDARLAELERNFDYVAIFGYKVIDYGPSHLVTPVQHEVLEHILLYAKVTAGIYDAFPLHEDKSVDSRFRHNLFIHHRRGMLAAAGYVIRAMNVSVSMQSAMKRTRVFSRNSLVIKPKSLRVVAAWMRLSMNVARRSPTVLKQLEYHSFYRSPTKDVAPLMFNQSDYLRHPFVYERMTAIFAAWSGLRVCFRFAHSVG